MTLEFDAVVDPAHPALPGHFPGNPVVPAVVLLAEVAAAIEAAMGPQAQLRGLPSVKFLAPLAPAERFRIVLEPLAPPLVRFSLVRDGRPVATGTAETGV